MKFIYIRLCLDDVIEIFWELKNQDNSHDSIELSSF